MKELATQHERRSLRDRRRGLDRRDPESTVLRVPGHADRRGPNERRHAFRRAADHTAARSGSRPKHG
jgi:hypothetical protein